MPSFFLLLTHTLLVRHHICMVTQGWDHCLSCPGTKQEGWWSQDRKVPGQDRQWSQEGKWSQVRIGNGPRTGWEVVIIGQDSQWSQDKIDRSQDKIGGPKKLYWERR
ncbi:hypothetical protein B0T22DRAFT_193909 [Podospora appendiculata]|uniref:Secreted protein n=1 Tax=Podospora appendiculata TaxID=314037 RepID=A0AAE0XD73_9PEZI|nr:hypothetical protein B0T22DRAFT_193909 [Podospora appendiculata]